MAEKPLVIKKRGDDGHRIITIRIREELLQKIDKTSAECNYSRNELINLLLNHGIENLIIEE